MASSKQTPETIAKILVALAKGCPLNTAALAANVSEATVRKWMVEDEDLALQIDIAMSSTELLDVELFDEIIRGEDKKLAVETAKWRRSRLNPAVWGNGSRNDAFSRDQKIRELTEELRREGISITEQQVAKELVQLERKSLPSGDK